MRAVRIILRVVIIMAAAAGLIWVNLTVFVTAGSVIGTVLFGALLLGAVFYKPLFRLIGRLWRRIPGRIALIAVGTVTALGAGLCVFFTAAMLLHIEKPLPQVKCVMVLGCQVVGETPSYMLADRLDRALVLLEENPDAVCIVAGGQGRGESITEAEAMRRYLTQRGVSRERILIEDKSTSTAENFAYCADILKQRGLTDGIAVVTTEFHQYRASIYARRNGLETGHYSSQTEPHSLLNYWIREWAALAATALLGY